MAHGGSARFPPLWPGFDSLNATKTATRTATTHTREIVRVTCLRLINVKCLSARALIARHASPVLSSFFCECVKFVGCSLHCFEGFPTFTKTITSNFDSTWKTEYKNPSRANSKVKLWSFSFHLLCKFSFDVYAHPWVFFPLSPLPLWFLCIETFLATAVQTMIYSKWLPHQWKDFIPQLCMLYSKARRE